MRTIGNILWLVLAGWWLALAYALLGLISFVLIVTIPFGIAAFRLAGYVLWPFGRTTRFKQTAGFWSIIGNVVWVVVFGWQLAVGHLVAGVLLCLTIIGIPLGLASFKMVPLALLPLGQQVISRSEAATLDASYRYGAVVPELGDPAR
jgi:uncharacterized membrane protein YccF (DUF307 family)